MTFDLFMFYVLAAILVFAAFRVITVRNPVHAVLNLVLAFFTSAGLWLLLEAEFLAITLVLVYVGAVMVLFLFVVMMLDMNMEPIKAGFTRYMPVGALVAFLIVVEMSLVVGSRYFGLDKVAAPERHPEGYSNVEALGNVLYTEYVYAFEIAAVILLVAIIAAIALTMRKSTTTKKQNPSDQVSVNRADRVRMVSGMSAEKGE